ncbi:hypothetical protein GCM10017779_40790 [Streptomyces capillispiralis]|nr:hypothetical protein GCM10017779_40790 [Streptomyces capillispiralis]
MANVGAAERMDADQHHHEALEVVLRMAEDAGQPVRGLLPKGPEDERPRLSPTRPPHRVVQYEEHA